MRTLCLILGLFITWMLHSEEKKTNKLPMPLTPEKEYEQLTTCAKSSHLTLAEAVKELTQGITDPHLKEDFIHKIAEIEASKPEGELVLNYENGQAKMKAFFKKGKPDGHVHGWYQNGTEAFKGYFAEGKKIGIHIAFFPPEISKSTNNIGRLLVYNREGKLEGEQNTLHPDGSLKVFVTYKNGLLDGKTLLYNENRKLIKECHYEKGKLITEKSIEPQ